jgi:hypothetical protein
MAALELTEPAHRPAKVYWTTAPRSGIARLMEVFRELAEQDPNAVPEGAGEAGSDEEAEMMATMGLPDDEISTWVDTTAYAGQKFDSLAAHASQGENIAFLHIGRERFADLMGVEAFVRVQDRTGAPLPEDDLFAGLR